MTRPRLLGLMYVLAGLLLLAFVVALTYDALT